MNVRFREGGGVQSRNQPNVIYDNGTNEKWENGVRTTDQNKNCRDNGQTNQNSVQKSQRRSRLKRWFFQRCIGEDASEKLRKISKILEVFIYREIKKSLMEKVVAGGLKVA